MATQVIPEPEASALALQTISDGTVIAEFESVALKLETEAKAIVVTDQESLDNASAHIQEIDRREQIWENFIKRPYDVVFGAYKKILELKKAIAGPLDSGRTYLKGQVGAFIRKQEAERREQERLLAEEQRKQEDELKLKAAASAETAGVDEKGVQEILSAPSTAPRPAAPMTYRRPAGLSTRENWAGEVEDFHALVKAAAKNKNLLPLLQINQPALNAQARVYKGALSTYAPGTRGVDKGAVSVRKAG